MKLENIWSYGLLEDVKRDALRKADGEKPAVQVYAAVKQILDLDRLAAKEGLLALEDATGDIQPELADLSIIPEGIDYIVSGFGLDLTAEMLCAGYWTKNPQGMEALAFFICIRGLVEIQRVEYSTYALELLLKSFLTEECRIGYEAYKAEREPLKKPVTPQEKLMEKELELGTKGSLIRNRLEEMLDHAPDSVVKEMIYKIGPELALAIRGLSNKGKERLFSCMQKTRSDSICEDIEYMGPVREVDIEDAFVCMIDCINDIFKKASGE